MNNLAFDFRYVLRSLTRNPLFSILTVITLALGIGANTAIFTVTYGVLLRPLPYPGEEQLVLLRQSAPGATIGNMPFSIQETFDYRAQSETLDNVVEYHNMSFTLLGRGDPERVQTGVVSAEYFDVLGIRPLHGRTFAVGDDELGAEAVLVLSHGYWQRSFGADPGVIGEVFEMNDRPHRVVGVLPPIPQFPNQDDVYMPTSACPFRANAERNIANNRRAFAALTVLGRRGRQQSHGQVQLDLDRIAERLRDEHPDVYPDEGRYTVEAIPLKEELTRQARPTLLMLIVTAALVLVGACANVANLMLARRLRRSREDSLRQALGAGSWDLFRLRVTESLILALTGGAFGLLLANWGLEVLTRFVASFTPRAIEVSLDGAVLLFTLAVTVATGLVFGALPSRKTRLVESLNDATARTGAGAGRLRMRSALIVAQVAISFVLLFGAGLMLRSLFALQSVERGFRTDQVMTARLSLNWSRFTSRQQIADFYGRLLSRIKELPGVLSAGVSNGVPLTGQAPFNNRFQIEGRPERQNELLPELELRVASDGYFETLGIPLLGGRHFGSQDSTQGPAAAIINQTMARRHWNRDDPVGKRISVDEGASWLTIVGVVGDVRQHGLDQPELDVLYRPASQLPILTSRVVVRTLAPPDTFGEEIRGVVRAVDALQPVDAVMPLADFQRASLASPRLLATLLSIFAGLMLAVTVAGIGGILSFSVTQRSHEFGIRMAMGARTAGVIAMVVRQGMLLVGAGLFIGGVSAAFLAGLVEGLLFEVSATDPASIVLAVVALLLVGGLACYWPARRVLSVDPAIALRGD